MSLRVLLVAAPLASLLFFSASVVARVNVTANCTLSSFAWVEIDNTICGFLSDLMALYPDIQLNRPKPVHSRSIHFSYMLRAV
jgi:hypothetical protein